MNATRWEIHFSGRVQGVGFRYTSAQVARRFDVTGWVKNLDCGDVQMMVEGSSADVAAYVDAVCEETHGRVGDRHVRKSTATGEFADFSIRH